MRVRIYEYATSDGAERFNGECELAECFPDRDDKEKAAAFNELQKSGRYWTGGGASPLVLLMKAE